MLRAIATVIVPESAHLDAGGWSDVERIIDQAILERPARMQRQLALFLRVLNTISVLRHARGFVSLSAEARTRVLESLEQSSLLLLRRGVWGIRTIVMMGYYARPAAAQAIGYRASPRGWAALQQ